MKYFIFISTILLISCGGGGNASTTTPPQQESQVETITFKNVPENLTIFD